MVSPRARKPRRVFPTLSRMHTPTLLAVAILAACAPATLPPPAAEPKTVAVDAAKEKTEGFAALFNGKDLGGWVGDTKGYKV